MARRTYTIDDSHIGMSHPDVGCSYAPKCLNCDLVLCRHDLDGGLAAAIKLTETVNAEMQRRVEIGRRDDLEEGRKILYEVALEYGVTVYAITSTNRSTNVVQARWKGMRRLRDELNLKLATIGALVHRDYTTVIYGLRRAGGETRQQAALRRNGVTA